MRVYGPKDFWLQREFYSMRETNKNSEFKYKLLAFSDYKSKNLNASLFIENITHHVLANNHKPGADINK